MMPSAGNRREPRAAMPNEVHVTLSMAVGSMELARLGVLVANLRAGL